MNGFREREVIHVAYLWEASGGPWLIGADFTEVGGRLECVGLSMRSFVKDEAGPPDDRYEAVWTPSSGSRERIIRMAADPEAVPESVALSDPDAVDAGALAREDLALRPLQSTTLRELPIADVLTRVRRQVAEWHRAGDYMPPEDVLDAGEVAITDWQVGRADAFSARETASPRRGGRPPKYTREDLQEVARLYREAFYRQQRPAPTKHVAEQLGVSANVASKLVSKCRSAGLLGPTEKRKAGGVQLPENTNERGEE